jgi:hypothetical protein
LGVKVVAKSIKKLTWIKRNIGDGYSDKHYITIYIFVPYPTREYMYSCIFLSVKNNLGKVLIKFKDVESLKKLFMITRREREKLDRALIRATLICKELDQEEKLLYQIKRKRIKTVDMDTGELISEAERIINDHRG